jgi:hypothetical protein
MTAPEGVTFAVDGQTKVAVRGADRELVGETAMPCPTDELVEMMFGRVLTAAERPRVEIGDQALRLDDVTFRDRDLTTPDL